MYFNENSLGGVYYTSTQLTRMVQDILHNTHTKWDNNILQPLEIRYQQIQKYPQFSDAFMNIIGDLNSKNIYGCESPYLLENFWYSYLEFIISNIQDENPDYTHIETRPNGQLYIYPVDYYLIFYLLLHNLNSVLNAGIIFNSKDIIPHKQESYKGIIDFFSRKFEMPIHDSMMTISRICFLDIRNILNYSRELNIVTKRLSYGYAYSFHKGFKSFLNQNIDTEFKYIETYTQCPDDLFFYDKYFSGAQFYLFGNNKFYIPGYRYNNSFFIGAEKPNVFLLNQRLLQNNRQSLIIFFQDFYAAYLFDRKIDRDSRYGKQSIIITSHISSDFNLIPWNFFRGHNVLFIPAPSKWHMSLIKNYAECLEKASVQSFKISKRLFLAFSPSTDNWRNADGLTCDETELLKEAILINDDIDLLKTFTENYDSAYTIEEYQRWAGNINIIKHSNTAAFDNAQEDIIPTLPEPSGALNPPYTMDLSEITLTHIFRPCNYIAIYGAKRSGKTSIGYAISQSLICGNNGLELFKSNKIENENICYIDKETDPITYEHLLKKCDLYDLLNVRFFHIWGREKNLPDFCKNFDLRNETFREGLRKYIFKNRCRYLFLDNLVSLTHLDTDSHKTKILDWINQLIDNGLCVILFIHKDDNLKEDKKRSSQEYFNSASVAINLYGKREFPYLSNIPELVKNKAKSSSLTVGINFQDIKSSPILIDHTLWVHQPLGKIDWEYLAITNDAGDLIDYSKIRASYHQNKLNTYINNLSQWQKEFYDNNQDKLDNDEKVIFAYALSNGQVKTGDLEHLISPSSPKSRSQTTGPQATKSREILRGMVDKGILRHNGKNGSNSAYLPPEELSPPE